MQKGHFVLQVFIFSLVALLVAAPFVGVLPFSARADTTDPAVTDCTNYLATAPKSELSDPSSKSSQCTTLIELYAELAQQQQQLAGQKNISGTLTGDIKQITSQITLKKTQIQAKITAIGELSDSINQQQQTIQTLSQKIDSEKQSIAQLLRQTNESDNSTLIDFLLSAQTLSDFSSDAAESAILEGKIKSSVDTVNTIEGVTEDTEAQLQKEQDQTIDEKQSLVQAQNDLTQQQQTQKSLLSISKDKETQYQKLIAEQQAKVADIKAKLFTLAGGAQAIRFDQALAYADQASAKTGIDPAYLLAELTQESGIGQNVGQCYLTDTTTGAGVNVKSGRIYPNVMKPSRDIQPFLNITGALGYNAQKTVVSCPIQGVAGYGGAMGPAQFIASTWVLIENESSAKYGVSVSNPWSPSDSFMASAMFLADLGGSGMSASAQLRASCKYYGSGGSTCSYGRSVQSIKVGIQSDIDYLQQYGVTKDGN